MARRSSSADDEVLETDSQGRPTFHRTKSGINITYKYSENPHVEEIFKDGKLACKVVYGPDNITLKRTYFGDDGQEFFTLDENRNIVANNNEHEQSEDK